MTTELRSLCHTMRATLIMSIEFSRKAVMAMPDMIPKIKAEAKATLELIGYCERLMQLRQYEDWGRFDWGLMVGWANKVDEPFVKLMLSLSKHHYHYGAISMHRWWRRLKAVNQQHLVQYFTYQGFPPPEGDKKLFWMELYEHCCRTHQMFNEMSQVFKDDRSVEMNLRAMLGCSQQKDIKEAWTAWAKLNHPDKGGSVEKFVLVKAAYEEYIDGKT